MAHTAFTEFGIGSGASCGYYDWRQSLAKKRIGVIEASFIYRRRAASILCGAEDDDCVRGLQLLLP